MNIEYIQCTLLINPLFRKVDFKQVLVHICGGTRGVSAAYNIPVYNTPNLIAFLIFFIWELSSITSALPLIC